MKTPERNDKYNTVETILKVTGCADYVVMKQIDDKLILLDFKYGTGLKHFHVTRGITNLADACFSGVELERVTITSTVTEIGELCFANCPNLKEIRIHRSHEKFVDKLKAHNSAKIVFLD